MSHGGEARSDRPAGGLLRPLRVRDFRLLWTGMTVSLIGDGMFLVALAWQVYGLSNSPAALAGVGIAMTVPHLVLLLAGGVVSDRLDRRRVMVVADVVRCVAVAALGGLSVAGALELWHVMAIAAVYGGGTAFFGPAFDAVVPELVPDDLLQQANSLDQFVRPAALGLAGPALGGLVISIAGVGGAFLFDAASFAVSIVAILRMRPGPALERPPMDLRIARREIGDGFRYVRSQVWLWGTFLAATIAYLLFWGPADVLLPFVVKNEMHRSARDLGFILAVGGLGAILAAVVMSRRTQPRRHITFLYVVWTISTLAIAGYGLARYPWQAMVAAFTFNALEAAGTIVWATTKQRFVPNRLLGRVSSFDWFISIGLIPVSYALTGPIAAWLGARTTLVVAGVLGAVATISFLFLPGMRRTERVGTAEPEPTEPAPPVASRVGSGAVL
jgi:MFS family permease